MILVDTGPIVALFDPADPWHRRFVERLKRCKEPLVTTTPVLTEAFHLLDPASPGSVGLMDFVIGGGMSVWHLDDPALVSAFELMQKYVDQPMDLADATLVAAAEVLNTRRIMTVDRRDFLTYRIRRGHRSISFELVE
jgi:predicted nucleic acid-binding protein